MQAHHEKVRQHAVEAGRARPLPEHRVPIRDRLARRCRHAVECIGPVAPAPLEICHSADLKLALRSESSNPRRTWQPDALAALHLVGRFLEGRAPVSMPADEKLVKALGVRAADARSFTRVVGRSRCCRSHACLAQKIL